MASGLLFNMRLLRRRNGARVRIGVGNREGRRTSTTNTCSPIGTLPMQEIRVDALRVLLAEALRLGRFMYVPHYISRAHKRAAAC